MEYTFKNLNELRQQAEADGAWDILNNWLNKQKNLGTAIENCPMVLRGWLLRKGYIQFARPHNLQELTGDRWALLVAEQPEYAEQCEWYKLNGKDWSQLLSVHPQHAEECDWSKLYIEDWRYLLDRQPQFTEQFSQRIKNEI